jgi:hypothetical protein
MSDKSENSGKIQIQLPQEAYELIELQGSGLSAICLVNKGLLEFQRNQKNKAVFGWQLRITVDLKQYAPNGLATDSERKILDAFFQQMDAPIKGNHNALWLGRVTWNKTQELIWRVHNPQVANDIIMDLIETEKHERPFDYSIDPDEKWEKAAWLLDPLEK